MSATRNLPASLSLWGQRGSHPAQGKQRSQTQFPGWLGLLRMAPNVQIPGQTEELLGTADSPQPQTQQWWYSGHGPEGQPQQGAASWALKLALIMCSASRLLSPRDTFQRPSARRLSPQTGWPWRTLTPLLVRWALMAWGKVSSPPRSDHWH